MSRLIVNGQEVDLEAIAKEAKKTKNTENTEPKERRETFKGDGLEISGVFADIDIQPAHTDKITVIATGPAYVVDRLQIDNDDGVILISGKKDCTTATTIIENSYIGGTYIGRMVSSRDAWITNVGSVHNFGGSTMIADGMTVITGDDIVINTGEAIEDTKLSLKITAPIYTEIKLSDIAGSTVIGDLQNDVTLELEGENSVKIANVRHLKLEASGSYNVTVKEVTGSAKMDLSGSGEVQLQSGYAEKLEIEASGACNVDAQVTARRADLATSGVSIVRVKEVTGRCRKDRGGLSKIIVG